MVLYNQKDEFESCYNNLNFLRFTFFHSNDFLEHGYFLRFLVFSKEHVASTYQL